MIDSGIPRRKILPTFSLRMGDDGGCIHLTVALSPPFSNIFCDPFTNSHIGNIFPSLTLIEVTDLSYEKGRFFQGRPILKTMNCCIIAGSSMLDILQK